METSARAERSLQPLAGHPPRAASPASNAAAQRRRSGSATFLIWLRRVHMYVGLWGAALGLLFGATGIVLNHRAVLKLPIDKLVQRSAQLPLPDEVLPRLKTPQQLADWLKAELRFDSVQTHIKSEPQRTVVWGDREVAQPERWSFILHSPQRGVSAEYFVGNRSVKVETQDATPIGLLTRLHMSVGANAFWVLLADTVAGGLVVLSVTGLLLWSRLRPIRLSSVCVGLAALAGAAGFLLTTSL
jgi:hypothetical protein